MNDKIYVQLTSNASSVANKPNECKIVTITPGNYTLETLCAEMVIKMNAAYSPQATFTVTPNTITNTMTIKPVLAIHLIKILTDSDIATGMAGVTVQVGGNSWNGAWNGVGANAYDFKNPQDINDILNNTDGYSSFFSASSPHVTGYIDLQPIKNIYMYSTNLGSFSTIGCKGEVTIIKKIPVTANENQMIFSNVTSSSDWLDCSRQTLKTLQFELKDSNDNNLNLHGAHVSFSLSFDKYREVE